MSIEQPSPPPNPILECCIAKIGLDWLTNSHFSKLPSRRSMQIWFCRLYRSSFCESQKIGVRSAQLYRFYKQSVDSACLRSSSYIEGPPNFPRELSSKHYKQERYRQYRHQFWPKETKIIQQVWLLTSCAVLSQSGVKSLIFPVIDSALLKCTAGLLVYGLCLPSG